MSSKSERIRLLPQLVADQIAAGEVVERPASVLKELIENSLDADASVIDIKLEGGGIKKIQVTDNGLGINRDDLLLAINRHATSKLYTSEDLSCIKTLGFRGEALASIFSVSNATLISREQKSFDAWQVIEQEDAIYKLIPSGHQEGTTAIVSDLFNNVPARKHFLRSASTELRYCLDIVERLALTKPLVSFRCYHEQKLILNWPSNKEDSLKKRVANMMGKSFLENSKEVTASATGLSLHVWLGNSELARTQADKQFLAINGRVVKDKLLFHALRQYYGDAIAPGKYPVYVCFLEIDPESIDVNVHPTKHEVRFRQSRLVHDFLTKNLLPQSLEGRTSSPMEDYISNKQKNYLSTNKLQDWQIYTTYNDKAEDSKRETQIIKNYSLFVIGDNWLVSKKEDKLALINLHGLLASLARITFQSYLDNRQKIVEKTLLIPETIHLRAKEISILATKQDLFSKLGINFSVLGEQQLVVRSLPTILQYGSCAEIFKVACEYIPSCKDQDNLNLWPLLEKLACLSSPKNINSISDSNRQSLLQNVFNNGCPNIACNHGYKPYYYLGENDLEKLLKQKSVAAILVD